MIILLYPIAGQDPVMARLTQITSALCLVFGLAVTGLASVRLLHPSTHAQDRQAAIAPLILLGLPVTGLGAWLAWDWRQQRQAQAQTLIQAHEQVFLELLQTHKGRLTLVQFAAAAQMPLDQARVFLDHRAKLLDASFDVTDAGGIVYQFPL
ncbi:MAG: hypothetical protein EA342_15885 [Leptolyngbya sp. LCM1.Bin17]|nr:MAG: hypothetical protein EA342_15885 [Leptolyngbya sp. LCM1.Bin17]